MSQLSNMNITPSTGMLQFFINIASVLSVFHTLCPSVRNYMFSHGFFDDLG